MAKSNGPKPEITAAFVDQVADAVAKELGPDWRPLRLERFAFNVVYLERADTDARLALRVDLSTRQLRVSGVWPETPTGKPVVPQEIGALHSSAQDPALNVHVERPARAIAGEIRRRLLDEYLSVLAKCRDCLAMRAAEAAVADQVANRLAAIVGAKPSSVHEERHRRVAVERDGYNLDLTIDGGSAVRLFLSAHPDVIERVLRALVST